MARFDSSLGMWVDEQGGYHQTQSEAVQADQNNLDADEFMGTSGIEAKAPDAPGPAAEQPNPNNPGGISDAELRRRSEALSSSATRTANINRVSDRSRGYGAPLARNTVWENMDDQTRAGYGYMGSLADNSLFSSPTQILNRLGERAGISHAGDVANPASTAVFGSPEGMFTNRLRKMTSPTSGLGQTLVGDTGNGGRPVSAQSAQVTRDSANAPLPVNGAQAGVSGAPSFEQGAGRTGIDQETADAKLRAGNTIEQNRDENAQLFADAFANYENLAPSDYSLSDEARGYQREGLQQQRALLQRMLGFDEDQYAKTYADRGLSQLIAGARSAGGGAAAQQANYMAAMEAAPGLYSQGQREASSLGNQRLQMAEGAAKAFGDLGTMTRGQDEQRAQFESNLGVNIADSVARLTEGNVQMNDRDSQQMAEIWMDFAKLQSVYAGMTSDEQLAWWQQETARRGQDKQFEGIMQSLKEQGKVTSKDLIGGLFQLGGGLVTTGGTMGAAYINAQGRQAA